MRSCREHQSDVSVINCRFITMFQFVLSRLNGKKLTRRGLCSICLLELGDMSTEWDHICRADKKQNPYEMCR